MSRPIVPLAVRIDRLTVTDDHGCWIWQGKRTRDGYGSMNITVQRGVKQTIGAHRVSYEITYGAIPAALELDHLCRNRLCVNPDHLEAVTSAENARRGQRAQMTHCSKGHPFNGANLRLDSTGGRVCRTCRREGQRRRRAQPQVAAA